MEAIAAAAGPVQQWQPDLAQQWAVHLAWLATHLQLGGWPPRLGELLVESTSLLVQVGLHGSQLGSKDALL